MHEVATTANDTPVAKGPYPEHVGKILESLYKSGMTGWGAKHSANLDQAVRSTGLNLSQVKVQSNPVAQMYRPNVGTEAKDGHVSW